MKDQIKIKKERRKHLRDIFVSEFNYKVMVSYKVMMPSEDTGTTKNISEGGICLVLDRELSPGAVLELKFEFPNRFKNPIKALVKVVWQKKTEMGFLTGVKFET